MKTIRNALKACLFLGLILPAWAFAQPWEIAVVFLTDNDSAYQRDIDQNILELARLPVSSELRLGILREFSDRVQEFHPNPRSTHLESWDRLFFSPPYAGIPVAGEQNQYARTERENIWRSNYWPIFLRKIFKNPRSKRMLILYGHGEGSQGLRQINLPQLKSNLLKNLPPRQNQPPLDILWLNSCFMGNLETAYELRRISNLLLASQEAEFSAGAPFDQLMELPEEAEAAAAILAERYLESYSYLASGSQRLSVQTSSATIAAIRLDSVEKTVSSLKNWMKRMKLLTVEQRRRLQQRLQKWQMEKSNLVDLGGLALITKDVELNELLQIKNKGALKTNPRIRLSPPKADAKLIYGYQNWLSGHEKDRSFQDRWPLPPQEFLAGPRNRKWPSVVLAKTKWIAPFTVGQKRFDYVFLDSQTNRPLESPQWAERQSDYIIRRPASGLFALQGYTQGKGAAAEKYSGINILNPFPGIPSTDYLDTEFFQESDWGNWQ